MSNAMHVDRGRLCIFLFVFFHLYSFMLVACYFVS